MAGQSNSGKKNRKYGRCKDSIWYKSYTIEGRQVKNKAKKIAKHQKKHPNDKQTVGTIPTYKKAV